jgi:hypothetical protein
LQAPEELLERLQRCDPALDLVYAGRGEWWLGRVKPDSPRRQSGLKMLAFLEEVWGRNEQPQAVLVPLNALERFKKRHLPRWLLALWPVRCERHTVLVRDLRCPPESLLMARLMIQGFGLIDRVTWPEVPDGRLIRRYQESAWAYRHTAPADWERNQIAATRGDAKKEAGRAKTKDYLETEGRSVYRYHTRHSHTVQVAGRPT